MSYGGWKHIPKNEQDLYEILKDLLETFIDRYS